MWARFRTAKIKKDGRDAKRNLNVNEEYLCALRTKSFADCFTKGQLLVKNQQISPSSNHRHNGFTENTNILLEPGQETIAAILESALVLSKSSDLKGLIFNYFDISAEASKICTHLLQSINQIQSNYTFIQHVLDIVDEYPPDQVGLIIPNLRPLIVLNNPFSDLNRQDFTKIRDKYSLVLQNLKLKRKKVERRIKMINCFNKASGICVTAACSVVAIAAMVLAAHTLTVLIMGPAIFSLPLRPLKKKLIKFTLMRSGYLRKVGQQLDVAAKGTYILNRDFDMMSRLVGRLHDEIEHNKAMIELCLERREDKFSLQVLKELKKSEVGFRKQVEELEEHVYLCLVTINRARSLVAEEITASCTKKLV